MIFVSMSEVVPKIFTLGASSFKNLQALGFSLGQLDTAPLGLLWAF